MQPIAEPAAVPTAAAAAATATQVAPSAAAAPSPSPTLDKAPNTTPAQAATAQHPSGDKRFKILETVIKRHQQKHEALIEVLHKAQELFGFLDNGLLIFIARNLRLPPSRVYGVATFYHYFTLKPKGEHTCVVCMGTACYVKGANQLLESVERIAGIKAGETTPDGKLSLVTARCIGACGIAPAVVYDGTVTPRQTPEQTLAHVKGWLQHAS